MNLIEHSLCRLHDCVNRLVGPSVALQDIQSLMAQIELRRLALRDIEAIRSGLRPLVRGQNKRPHPRRQQSSRMSRSRLETERVRRTA